MGEKHYPANGDLPRHDENYTTLSVEVLIKLDTDLYTLGFYNYETRLFVEYDRDSKWPASAVEAWWYLPE